MFRMLLPRLLQLQAPINGGSIKKLYDKYNLGEPIYSRSYANSKNKVLQETYDSQIQTIFIELVKWTIDFESESESLALSEKWAILRENFSKFYDSKPLQKQGKKLLETVYLLLQNQNIDLGKKIFAIQQIDKNEFSVCAPGIYTHLQEFVFSLTLNPMQCLKEQIIKAHALEFIHESKRIGLISKTLLRYYIKRIWFEERMHISAWSAVDFVLQDWELHYVNGLMDGIAKEWGLSYSQDLFVDSCDIKQDFINQFNKRVKKKFFASFMQAIEKLVAEQVSFIKSNAYAKTLDVLNETMDGQLGQVYASQLREEILNFDLAVEEYAETNFYNDTDLSKKIIHLFYLKKLIADSYIHSSALQTIVVRLQVAGEQITVKLLFCKESSFFIVCHNNQYIDLTVQYLIDTLDIDSCVGLVNSNSLFACLLANYTDYEKIEFFVKLANRVSSNKRLLFINLAFVKNTIRNYVKNQTSFDEVLSIFRLQLLANTEKKAIISDYFDDRLRFLQCNFYTLLAYLDSMSKENKLAFICLFFIEPYEINHFDWQKLLKILESIKELPSKDISIFFALPAVQRALRGFMMDWCKLKTLKERLGNNVEFSNFLSLYVEGNDLIRFSDNPRDFIELLNALPKCDSYSFIAAQAEKIKKFNLTLTLEKLIDLIKAIPKKERWLAIQLPHIQVALSKALDFNTKNLKLLFELFSEAECLNMIKLELIQARLSRNASLDVLLEILSSIPLAQRLPLTNSPSFTHCLAKGCYSIAILIKILQALPLTDRTEFFRNHAKYWFGKRITKESIDTMLDLFPGINKSAIFEKIAVGDELVRKCNSVLTQELSKLLCVSTVNEKFDGAPCQFFRQGTSLRAQRVEEKSNCQQAISSQRCL